MILKSQFRDGFDLVIARCHSVQQQIHTAKAELAARPALRPLPIKPRLATVRSKAAPHSQRVVASLIRESATRELVSYQDLMTTRTVELLRMNKREFGASFKSKMQVPTQHPPDSRLVEIPTLSERSPYELLRNDLARQIKQRPLNKHNQLKRATTLKAAARRRQPIQKYPTIE